MLNSLVKLDVNHHAGAVQNMKFSKDLFNNHRDILESLLNTYFDNGGAQAMITVVSRDDLEQAMIHPEKYGHIMVGSAASAPVSSLWRPMCRGKSPAGRCIDFPRPPEKTDKTTPHALRRIEAWGVILYIFGYIFQTAIKNLT